MPAYGATDVRRHARRNASHLHAYGTCGFGVLLFDPQRIDPAAWLNQRFRDVKIVGKARTPRAARRKARRQRQQGRSE
jgi:hypothetical protein